MTPALLLLTVGEIYEALYQNGYHSDLHLSHARGVLQHVRGESVLDLGCSHGFAVAALWKRGIVANGVDIAPSAIALARRTRGEGRCGPDPCFQVANATALPFGSKHFDALVSTDVLEHLSPSDVDAAVREMVRVTRRDMWLKIATERERDAVPLETLHRKRMHTDVRWLHTTVMGLDDWAERFRRHARTVIRLDDLLHVAL